MDAHASPSRHRRYPMRNRRSLDVVVGIALICVVAAAPPPLEAADVATQEFDSALQSRPNRMHGNALFNDDCIACHGPDGGGQPDRGVPSVAGQQFQVIVRQLVNYRHSRRSDLRMEHFTGPHHLIDAQDIADVASYISRLPVTKTPDLGTGESVVGGQLAYTRGCAACHGARGEGDPRGIPRLAGQHYRYLLGQMQDAAEGRRSDFTIEHRALLQRFENEFSGIADYLARLGSAADAGNSRTP